MSSITSRASSYFRRRVRRICLPVVGASNKAARAPAASPMNSMVKPKPRWHDSSASPFGSNSLTSSFIGYFSPLENSIAIRAAVLAFWMQCRQANKPTGSVLICPCHAPRAASDVLRIHSETFCLLAFAALLNRSCSAFANRTGTILLFASPFGSLGLPTFLGFCWFATFELLSNRRPYRHCCRQNGRIQADASVLLAHESPNLIEL